MDKLNHYRTLVKKHLSYFAAYANRARPNGVETQCKRPLAYQRLRIG